MARALLMCVLVLLTVSTAAADAARRLLAIAPRSPWTLRELEAAGADLVSYDPETGVAYVTANSAEEQALLEGGFATSTVELDVMAGFERLQQDPGLGLYTTWEELVSQLATLHATFPELTQLEIIGTSVEGRAIQALKISDEANVDDPEEADVLIVGNHHARELMSVEVPLHVARTLLNGYRQDARIRRLVDTREIWIVPMLNPDGHVYQEATLGRPGWRKNRRPNQGGSVGVDLNRNYPFKWGLNDEGSSGEPLSETYRGVGPLSEPETTTLARFVERHDFAIALSYHSFGELLLFPWGHSRDVPSPDHGIYLALASEMVRDNGYRPGNAYTGAIYLTNGVWDDYMYGEVGGAKSSQTFAFTVELNSLSEGGFWPSDALIQPTCDRLLSLNLYAIEVASDVTAAAPPLPPRLSAVQDEHDAHVVHLDWEQPGDPSRIDFYEVFEIDPLGKADAWMQTPRATLDRDAHAVLASGVQLRRDGRLTLRLEGWLEPLWDYAYVEVRRAGSTEWHVLSGGATRVRNPTGRNQGNGLTGRLEPDGYTFDASHFSGELVDVAIRLDAYGDTPQLPRLSAAVDVPETITEERRVIARDIRETHYDVVAERPGIFAYGVTAVDHTGQRADSDIRWFVIPERTAVELQDVVLEHSGSRARLRWSMHSQSAARFEVFTRALRQGEVPHSVSDEWRSGLYERVASRVSPRAGDAMLEWELRHGRQSVLLVAEDGDGPRFWGPWVATRVAKTHLAPAWPNPFNPSTQLRFEIASTAAVQLDIMNVQGRLVRRLVARVLVAGEHSITWDGRDDAGRSVSSGVYVARLQTDAALRTRRLVLLR